MVAVAVAVVGGGGAGLDLFSWVELARVAVVRAEPTQRE